MRIAVDVIKRSGGAVEIHVSPESITELCKMMIDRVAQPPVAPAKEERAFTYEGVDKSQWTDESYRACASYSCNHIKYEHPGDKCNRKGCPCREFKPLPMVIVKD